MIYTIYKRIKSICDSRGISVRSIERKAGLGNGTISGWCKCSPTIEKIKAVAEALGCTVDELISEQTEEKEVV